MSDAQLIWRLGRWVAQRPHGSATLSWSGGALTLRVADGRVVGLTGLDPAAMGLASGTGDAVDALEEAVAMARRRGLPETEGVATVKKALEEALTAWLSDPLRRLEIVEEVPPGTEGPTISLRHVLVETVLVSAPDDLPSVILPDLNVVLRRAAGFLDQYASLQLSEEADLIVAKLTGNRTAEEVLERTPHDREEVHRLLAALVAAGLLEPVPVVVPEPELPAEPLFPDEPSGGQGRRLPVRWIVAGAIVLCVVLALAAFLVFRMKHQPPGARDGTQWGVVVDRGCEPKDLQRILDKAGRFPEISQAQPSDSSNGAPCWELIWGDFPSREDAERAIARIPRALRKNGLQPKAIRLKASSRLQNGGKGGDRAPG